VSIASNRF